MSESLQRVRVALGERSYEILIGRDLLSRAGEFFQSLGLGKRGVIITDSNVGPRYAGVVRNSLEQAGFEVDVIEIPAGETSKSLRQANRLFEKLPGLKLDRKSFVVALGGGVVGDLAGYIAACYLRGINFIQIPTSLLAQVDSSVGGKVGVNLPHGKNLVGAFYQPRLVLADTGTLTTLSKRELRSGFAEVIKYGAIADARFFAWLEKNHRRVLRLEPKALAQAVRRCCELKAMVVGKDERESGLREILNFGHTVGHAIEALADYVGLLHGEAVGVGMCTAGCLSVAKSGLKKPEAIRLKALIRSSGLPVKPQKDYGLERVLAVMRLDKKARAGKVRFVLLNLLGKAFSSDAVTDEDVEKALEASDVCCG